MNESEAQGELRPEGWSEEDIKWLNAVQPVVTRTVAIKYGRKLFALVWQSNVIGEALLHMALDIQSIAKWGMKKQVTRLNQTHSTLLQLTNRTLMDATIFAGHTFEDFKACKEDLRRVIELSEAAPSQAKPGENVTPGGIILQ